MLIVIENIHSTGTDVPGVGLYWLTECPINPFW